MSLVRFGYCSYLLCNTWVVNLQQILQRYCSVLNELCTQDSDTVVNKLWHHLQQLQQVSNVTAFENLYAKLGCRSCFKTFFICTVIASKVILSLFIWTVDCMQFLSESCLHGRQIFGRFGFGLDVLYTNPNTKFRVFHTSLETENKLCML